MSCRHGLIIDDETCGQENSLWTTTTTKYEKIVIPRFISPCLIWVINAKVPSHTVKIKDLILRITLSVA